MTLRKAEDRATSTSAGSIRVTSPDQDPHDKERTAKMSHVVIPDHPIQDVLARRWSPYALGGSVPPNAVLASLFEAARWTPSSFNEQPWAFFLTTRDANHFEEALSCLVENNQQWARNAPILAFTVYRKEFTRNGKPNKAAQHDLGASVAHLTVEATSRGLYVHQMAGIVPERVREVFEVPEEYEPLTAFAIGEFDPSVNLEDRKRQADEKRRGRRPISEFVFGHRWGRTAPAIET